MTNYIAVLEDKTVVHIGADYFVDEGRGCFAFWIFPSTDEDEPKLVAHVSKVVTVGDISKIKVVA